jgi:hypothetical protein
MSDVLYVVLSVVLLGISFGFVVLCLRLMEG